MIRVRLAEAIIGVLICVPEGNQRERKQKVEAYAEQAELKGVERERAEITV